MTIARSAGALLLASAMVLTGCGREITGTAVTAAGRAPAQEAGDDAQCTTVTAPLVDIPQKNPREPQLRVPQPQGWERNTMMDNQIIRFAIVAQDLVADQFAPNAVVTLESVRGSADPDIVFEQNRSNLTTMMGAFDLQTESNTTCGLPSETTTYIAPAMGPAPQRPIIMHAVVARTPSATYLSTLTVQTTDATNPTYVRDSAEIVDGFQLLLP
ncbi:LpqN/LpqT family lipoprotein [Mycobacterium sp. PSTR-4-N]|uniref:LpqN/LpqT family lipoprotein n=1 Tax=Mycobacterium sp. PSTR-4-N TaxID=2917745 RepID=UPI001F15562D|nr:LpqN/LpqT family lipoprotein [Mycobacterium sp. PSTR-4-N]MCG7596589.1 LpqN/LpqT family lipoprotein [Mycobacterium sp. PSTR-4-N]